MRTRPFSPRRRQVLQAGAAAGGLFWLPSGLFTRRAAAADAPPELRYRQIHLDFHTSQHVTGIGADFDPEAFAATLERARVNSVTAFARCHHGYIYYDTKKNPERHHPHLKRNLLKEQIEACHKRNIRVPIYTTICWDQFTADAQPGWRQVMADGKLEGRAPFEAGFYRRLCLNTAYVDWLKTHVADIFDSVPVDGFFLDIVHAQDCACPRCLHDMAKQGIDASNEAARKAFGAKVTDRFRNEMTAFIRGKSKSCTIFYNGGHVGPSIRPSVRANSHLELESLPSGGWGYLHFPLTMRYARTLGMDALGMTGKFHTSWGDFHSLKNRAALDFECFNMLALGAKCSIGDQLHPGGKLDPATYELIGAVYKEVERKEPFCQGARPVVDIGVLSPEEHATSGNRTPPAARGVVRMLQEGAQQFDIVDSESELDRYKVLVLPDEIVVTPKLAAKLERYLGAGGGLVASYKSAASNPGFSARALGVKVKGDAPYSPDYIRARPRLAKGLPPTELVMYTKGLELQPSGAEVLADVVAPYFNRTWDRYFSHKHTPASGKIAYPGVVMRGRAITFAHPIFTQYAANAPRWCKTLVLNALDLLMPQPLVRHAGPSTVIAALNEQRAQRRQVLHLLHYVPERRGDEFDIVEDVLPLHELRVSIRTPQAPKSVQLVPEGQPIPFETKGGRTEFVLPKLVGHQMLALAFA